MGHNWPRSLPETREVMPGLAGSLGTPEASAVPESGLVHSGSRWLFGADGVKGLTKAPLGQSEQCGDLSCFDCPNCLCSDIPQLWHKLSPLCSEFKNLRRSEEQQMQVLLLFFSIIFLFALKIGQIRYMQIETRKIPKGF